jgi:hypothetical protein
MPHRRVIPFAILAFAALRLSGQNGVASCSAAPTEARSLLLSGAATTNFTWSAPANPNGTDTVRYDLLRSATPAGFSTGYCLATGLTAPGGSDASPATAFFYLVRARNSCGGTLGFDSGGAPITGVNCIRGNGDYCGTNPDCVSGSCCTGLCRDTQNDPLFCGGCGNVCSSNGMATVTCGGGVCNGNCATNQGDCNADKLTDGCETSVTTADHCGGCTHVCPGYGQATADATCVDPSTSLCGLTCKGENYDVDNNPVNGCERFDGTPPGHTQGTAQSLPSQDCFDTSLGSFSQVIMSDARVHTNPTVTGFNAATGAAPDWWSVFANGGFACTNDFSVTLSTGGGGTSPCYTLTVITNLVTQSCLATGSSGCNVSHGSGAYGSSTVIFFKVEKTCSSATWEAVNYSVQFHL